MSVVGWLMEQKHTINTNYYFQVNHNIFVVKAIQNMMTSVEHSYQKSCFGIIFVSTTVSKNTYPITVVRIQKLTMDG